MQLVSITPKNKWKEMFNQPIAMCLTHLIKKYPEYTNLVKSRPYDCYVILDNSMVEFGDSISLQDILNAANEVGANEIVLRGVYSNGPKTIQRIKEDIEYLRSHSLTDKYNIMAVCHGENAEDFKATFEYINSIPEITCIGIPEGLCRWLPSRSRVELASIFSNTSKDIHFLGSWFSLKELIEIPGLLRLKIRSCSTCLPSYYAIHNKSILEDREGTIDLEKEYPELTDEAYNNVLEEYYGYCEKKILKDLYNINE